MDFVKFSTIRKILITFFIKLDNNNQLEDVNFKIVQQSYSHVLAEIQTNHTFIYFSLIKSLTGQITSKGKISNSDSFHKKHYLFMETLEPATSYILKLYANLSHNRKKFIMIFSHNITTIESDQNISYNDYDYDFTLDANQDFPKRVINCELNVKETDLKGKNFQSLFTKLKSKKKYQIVTINYSSQLMASILNENFTQTEKYLSLDHVERFSSFFELPLCVFDFPVDVNSDTSEDYDYYDSTLIDDEEPNFNIHTSLELEHQTMLHIYSRCLRSNRPVRVPNGRSINLSSVKNSASEQIIFPIKEETSISFIPITKMQKSGNDTKNKFQPKVKQLSSYKKETLDSFIPNYLARHMTSINNCYIINNREIQFQIDKLPQDLNGQELNQRYRTILKNLAILSRFKFRIFNSSQFNKFAGREEN
ncbi:hypothetical protein BpHYR1_025578 [Brachionus plicatilis]|uniref:Uncharacterized protein n=1 Tax=Brachionus plicatilis TaxID=10195 RepID=A0A3M7S574_BRAPC|nr:hypothetical protein BpHYR1_025578 [Brachionus plicatilis]